MRLLLRLRRRQRFGSFADFGDRDPSPAYDKVRIFHTHADPKIRAVVENNVVIGQWDSKDDRIYYWCNNSFPSFAIQFLAAHLNIHIDRIRVQTFDIGGSFGIKITSYPQMAVCALASKKAGGRPIKWVETRSEHMTASAHGNERTFRDTRVALDKDGIITAITSRHIDDCGAYPRYEPLGCVIFWQRRSWLAPGQAHEMWDGTGLVEAGGFAPPSEGVKPKACYVA